MTSSNITSYHDDVIMYIKHEDILQSAGADIQPWMSVLSLFGLFFLFRLAGYVFLRVLHAPNKK